VAVIPFYGADEPELFAIERRAMDRDGLVIEALHELLPAGPVLDVGAGDGFTAERLGTSRSIVALEPSADMLARADLPARVQGEAEHLPFVERAFDGAYATWAYFFTRDWDPTRGIVELDRVVRPGGPLAIVDNLGGDAFAPTWPSGRPWASRATSSRPRSASKASRRPGACSASSSEIVASPVPRSTFPSGSASFIDPAAELDPAGHARHHRGDLPTA